MRKKKSILKSVTAFLLALVMTFSVSITSQAATAGIDVAKYQGSINWAAVAQSGMQFTFIKVGSTNSGIDPYFAANVRGAQAAGIRTGVYIYSYATSVEAAAQEAALVLQWIDGYNINFPVAYDIEDKVQKGLDANTVTAMCNTFCGIIAAAGYTPIVYTYANFYKSHMTSAMVYDKWIAHYSDHCDIADFDIWQYSSHGAVAGVNTRVDMDVATTDYAALIPQVGLLTLGDYTYVFNNYRKQFGWSVINNLKFHSDEATGVLSTGWFADATGTYYFGEGGYATTGLSAIGDGIYYFNTDGQMQTGWVELSGNTFLFNPNEGGKLYTGWWTDSAGTKYLDTTDGHLTKGLAVIGSDLYYFNDQGVMQTGWIQLNGYTYLFNPNDGGKLYKGFWKDAAGTHYLDEAAGYMVTGLKTINGSVYYFNDKGVMQTGLVTIGANQYYFNAEGKLQTGWVTIGTANYYFGADGAMVKGLFQLKDGVYGTSETDGHQFIAGVGTIAKTNFLFGTDGKLVVNAVVQIGDTIYATDANGVVTATAPAK